ncbi:MAG: NERD domain-containing protein [Gammaproteobacteria bacterium]|nr:NERD domain-containing protein [Gammaproteobacteria bacterium]
MPSGDAGSNDGLWVLGSLALLVLLLAIGTVLWMVRRNRRRDVERRLQDASSAVLRNALIPDGNGGQIQLQYALLTRRGILILDIKDVDGHVFGSEGMQEWTVLARDRRHTFANPQAGLWDRIAAVKRLTPGIPVTGYVAFGSRARFSKGQPRSVILLEELLQELERESQSAHTTAPEGFDAHWQQLCAAVDSPGEPETTRHRQA